VLNAAKWIDVWSQMDWHRRWERLPVRFTVLTTLAVVVASLFEIVPTFLIRSNVPTIASVKPYTPLELAGRDIYVSEGCYNCHSQMIRPMVAETKRYGEYSKPGEFIYDRPFQWGSRRIGPDLAREGGNKQTSLWHWQHLENPSILVEGSVMPSYIHLLETSIDFNKIQDRVDAAHMLGAPYDRELTEAPEMARAQAERIAADIVSQGGTVNRGDVMTLDSQAVALIAYLQRLGTDLNAPPEVANPEPAPAEETQPASEPVAVVANHSSDSPSP
jgi:cytochrome c oxidase cbb3-type subunit I/II